MANNKRLAQNIESLFCIADLLRNVIEEPGAFKENPVIMNALISQGALSKLSIPERRIFPTSINTMKRLAVERFPEGYDTIDRLRAQAQAASVATRNDRSTSKPITKNKKHVEQELKEIKTLLKSNRLELFLYTRIIKDLATLARRFASQTGDAASIKACESEIKSNFRKLTTAWRG